MPAKRIIPCLDVDDGRVVKGVRFQNLRDAGDPAHLATLYDPGGRPATGKDAVEWAVLGEGLGAGEILLTSMDNDGVQDGYDVALLKAVTSAVRLPVIASGGAGTAAHMYEALTTGGAEAALAA